ncbi:MAG TPA: type II toxin-antitoxin system prevent-host-death family antitoxin [Caulobacteraceae bacterium]|jgi:prevent-host-death family protein|nr:type II toxin-antitoxin system prevent-host-death family antitoxin [Caulobacteraceae bacterium]
MPAVVNLYDAKTQLSALVDRAAAGEEIIIAKNGAPRARLVPLTPLGAQRTPAGTMGITYIAEDFDAFDPEIAKLFNGD